MKTLSIIALTASLVAANLAMPAFAATHTGSAAPATVPYCSSGTPSDDTGNSDNSLIHSQMDALATQLGVGTQQIDTSNGCFQVSQRDASGKTVINFYDPDTLKLVATI